MVDREELRLDPSHPVDVEHVAPHRGGRGRSGAHGLDDVGLAGGDAVVVGEVEPVDRERLRPAVALEDGEHQLAAARAAPLRVGEGALLPPLGRAAEHPGRLGGDAVVDLREQPQRLVGRDEPGRARPVDRLREARVALRDLHVAGDGSEAVAEASVDAALRGPENRDRLAARMDILELGTHELPQDAAAAMRRQDSDHRRAGGTDRPAGNGQVELERAGAGDDLPAVDGDVYPALRDEHALGLLLLRAGRPAEVVPDRTQRADLLVGAGGADLDAHRTFSRGA